MYLKTSVLGVRKEKGGRRLREITKQDMFPV